MELLGEAANPDEQREAMRRATETRFTAAKRLAATGQVCRIERLSVNQSAGAVRKSHSLSFSSALPLWYESWSIFCSR